MDTTIFNELEYYNSEIIPIMEKLQEACEAKGLPYVCSVMYKQNNDGASYGVFMSTCERQGVGVLPLIISGAICKDIKKAVAAGIGLMNSDGTPED